MTTDAGQRWLDQHGIRNGLHAAALRVREEPADRASARVRAAGGDLIAVELVRLKGRAGERFLVVPADEASAPSVEPHAASGIRRPIIGPRAASSSLSFPPRKRGDGFSPCSASGLRAMSDHRAALPPNPVQPFVRVKDSRSLSASDKRQLLSPTQQRVSELLLAGNSLAEIGESLGVDPETVKLHTKHIYSRLGVGSRLELARALEE